MSEFSIKANNISKAYRKGAIGSGTLSRDIEQRLSFIFKEKLEKEVIKIEQNQLNWSLKDVNFEIQEGETVGIIGKNGAGKSTLLKILSKVTTPTKGIMEGYGRVASLLEVGTGFHPELSGRENIFLNGSILGMKKKEIQQNFDEIVDFSGVESYLDTPVKRYSSGMYVRLAFAVAAHLQSEILIIDEVLAVGDAEFQKKCLNKMGAISKNQGRTVVFVSHNMQSIQTLCSKTIFLEQGELAGFGKTSDMIQNYLNRNLVFKHISERIDRKGDGRVKVVDLVFIDAKSNKITNNFYAGMNLIIDLKLSSYQFNLKSNLEISLGINDQFGTRLTLISNKVSGQTISPLEDGVWTQKIAIYNLPFAMGNYSITLFIASGGVIHDWITEAMPISIESDRFFGELAQTLPNGQGSFYLNFTYL